MFPVHFLIPALLLVSLLTSLTMTIAPSPQTTRDMDVIRAAHKNRDLEASRKAHEASPLLSKEGHGGVGSSFVKSIVFGGLDGILTTFAVVSAAVGAADRYALLVLGGVLPSAAPGISCRYCFRTRRIDTVSVLIFGFANLFADGLAMGFGEYTSSQAEMDFARAEREREEWELKTHPEGEKKEMIDLYVEKGVSLEDATLVMETLMKVCDHVYALVSREVYRPYA